MVHSDFLRSNTTEQATYIQNLYGTVVATHGALLAALVSLAILSSKLAVEVWHHQMGS